jgi:hypothetical protein
MVEIPQDQEPREYEPPTLVVIGRAADLTRALHDPHGILYPHHTSI